MPHLTLALGVPTGATGSGVDTTTMTDTEITSAVGVPTGATGSGVDSITTMTDTEITSALEA